MIFKDSLRDIQIGEVKILPETGHGSYFTKSGPPSVTISTQVAGPWLWVISRANYDGITLDPTAETDGYDYSADVVHNWIGEAQTAPKTVSYPGELQDWAILHTIYTREVDGVGWWGSHEGRWVSEVTPEGIVKLHVVSNPFFKHVHPDSETTSQEVDLSIFGDRSFEALVKLLKRKNPVIRDITVKLLGRLGDTRAVDPFLIQATGDESWFVQEMATQALGKLGGDKAIQKLASMLNEFPAGLLTSISLALIEIGEPVLDSLIPILNSENEVISIATVKVFEGIGGNKAIKILTQALNDERSSVREHVVRALGELGATEAIDHLIRSLEDEDPKVQRKTIEALNKLKDKRAVEPLVGMLLARNKLVRYDAGNALAQLGWQPSNNEDTTRFLFAREEWEKLVAMGDAAIETMLLALNDDDKHIRERILPSIAMADVTFNDLRIYNSILKIFKDDKHVKYRQEAIKALKNIRVPEAVSFLINTYIHNKNFNVRYIVFDTLTHLVMSDVPVKDALISILERKKIDTLQKSEIEACLKLFTKVPISHQHIKTIKPWLEAIDVQEIDKDSTDIISGLLELDKLLTIFPNGDILDRESAIKSMGEIGLPAATTPLIKALGDSHPIIRQKAAKALIFLGIGALPEIMAALSNNDYRVRMGAAAALGLRRRRGGLPIRAAKLLLKNLSDENRAVRQNSAWAIGQPLGGKEAKILIPKIIQALTTAMKTDEYFPVQFNAVYGLGDMRDPRVVETLLEAVDSPAIEFRLNGTCGLIKLAGMFNESPEIVAKVVAKFISKLSDDVDDVRYNAAQGLRLYGGKKALNALIAVQDDKDPKMRELAKIGIKEIKSLRGKKRTSFGYFEIARHELRDPDDYE
ncbi:MAG: HEAT repeat domain-containing protein [Candidatus Hodarchaeota archaeon]